MKRLYRYSFLLLIFCVTLLPITADTAKKPMTTKDMMQWKEIHDVSISEKGDWAVFNAQPDRGNGSVTIYHIRSGKTYTIDRGIKPVISTNSTWVAATVKPDFIAMQNKAAKDKKKIKNSMALLNTDTGKKLTFERVKSFSFSKDSKWLYYYLFPKDKKKKKTEKKTEKKKGQEGENKAEKKAKKKDTEKKPVTSTLVLRRLSDGAEVRIPDVANIALDPSSRFLAYSRILDSDKEPNGFYIKSLKGNPGDAARTLHTLKKARYSNLTWSKKHSRLAFIFHKKLTGDMIPKPKNPGAFQSALMVWDGVKDKLTTAISSKRTPAGWVLPYENRLSWSHDNQRLFFGFKPVDEYRLTHPVKKNKDNSKEKETIKAKSKTDIYHVDNLLDKRTVDVWHWQDPLINPHQKKTWNRLKKRTYTSVYLFNEDRYIRLTDQDMPRLRPVDNPDYALGFSNKPYQREITWDGFFQDLYYVNLHNGTRHKLLEHFRQHASLSYHGRFIVYYKEKNWYLYTIRTGSTRNLTKAIKTPFYNEDHDYPSAVGGYGIAGWTENDQSVLIYDKYDIWEFYTAKEGQRRITAGYGREKETTFRVRKLDRETKFFKKGRTLLLSTFSHKDKTRYFSRAVAGKVGVSTLLKQEKKYFRFVAKAKKAPGLLFTRENFREFPDLWYSHLDFKKPAKKISNVNPQIKKFLWGKSRLIDWHNIDGRKMQGVVITPENYDPKKRYPVLVYYYRFFTQHLNRFNQIVVNHRPCFPYYVGNGYVMFLPDIRFQVGRPGFSATKSLVPGVQKLIDLGIADAKAIGLHGHSWSGYQTAFIITQTNLFAAAIAGAPVTNMTSAYNGIRWGSGQARQFQYEKSQSRIGPNLVEAPHLYIENSPVFFADRIQTPLLIQFGDQDGAVPWYQGIELYLTMRRFNKDCIFLQYNGEGHHLKKYSNKLDYTLKMKQYLDHYLKGEPPAKWITDGVAYRKK